MKIPFYILFAWGNSFTLWLKTACFICLLIKCFRHLNLRTNIYVRILTNSYTHKPANQVACVWVIFFGGKLRGVELSGPQDLQHTVQSFGYRYWTALLSCIDDVYYLGMREKSSQLAVSTSCYCCERWSLKLLNAWYVRYYKCVQTLPVCSWVTWTTATTVKNIMKSQ